MTTPKITPTQRRILVGMLQYAERGLRDPAKLARTRFEIEAWNRCVVQALIVARDCGRAGRRCFITEAGKEAI